MFELLNNPVVAVASKNAPILGSAIGFGKAALRLYNSTNYVEAVPRAIVEIVIDCSPPHVKYPVRCLGILLKVVLVASTGGTAFTPALLVMAGTELLEHKAKGDI